jgi:outer membrane receptor protein involved in Fe transport
MNLKVVTASKSSEKKSDAPAIVTVITKTEIEKLKGTTLLQLLDQLTAIYTTGSYCFRDNLAVIRGNVQTHINNNVLVLIDGRPMRESYYGGIESSIYNAFPINSIERIEIIRGPGSVLYGTNAFTGVINIITNTIDLTSTTVSANYGTFNTTQVEINSMIKKNEFKAMLGTQYLKDAGWDFVTTNESDTVGTPPSTIKYSQELFGIVSKIEYKDFKLLGVLTYSPSVTFGPVPTLPADIFEETRGLIDFGYSHTFTKKYNLSTNLTYNRYSMECPLVLSGPVLTPGVYDYFPLSNDYLFEVTNYFHPNDEINITTGFVALQRTGEALSTLDTIRHWIVPKYSDFLFSAYGQIDYQPFSFIKCIVGAQINKAPLVKLDLVPRFGLIFNLNLVGLKVLYAQAFRSQTAFEVFCDMPGIVMGYNELIPEKIGTFDIQISYRPKGFDLSFGYFNSDHTNQITREFSDEIGSLRYINGEWNKSYGYEFEGKCIAIPHLIINTSVAYQTSINKSEQKDASHIPNIMAKFSVQYEFNNGISLSCNNSYFGKPSDVCNINPNRKLLNPVPQAFNYLNAGIQLDIIKLLKFKKLSKVIFSIHGENLLDEKIYNPEFQRRKMNSIPGRPSRWVVVGISITL